MSDRDRPFDPFGRSDRTIIRPNPAGRRPAQPASAPAPAPFPVPPAADLWRAAPSTPHPPPPNPRLDPVPKGGIPRLDDMDAANENPIMRAAAPLLLLLGRLRANMVHAPSAQLMEQVAQAISEFDRTASAAGFNSEQVKMARYVLCATADDIVQNMPVEDRHLWTQYSMLSRFFGERTGGVRFFDELSRAKADPIANYAVLELMHACLAMGFEGIHRTSAGGPAALQQIQRGVYDTLRRIRPIVTDELSPHWQGQSLPVNASRRRVPAWAVASLASVLLFGLYIAFRMLLAGQSEVVAASFLGLVPNTPVAIDRPVPVPPPPPPEPPPLTPTRQITQLQRIRAALANEISAGRLRADQTANEIVITVHNLSLFRPGSATVLESFKTIAAKIAATLEKEPGSVKVIGHTDGVPIKTVRFPSNYELSVERAKAVADLLRPGLSKPDRVQVQGKGADARIVVPDVTEEQRARNRRVEIMIPRAD